MNRALLLHVAVQVSGLVGEAESGLRLALKTMGMRDTLYPTDDSA
jgi:hypothetical protein